MNVIIKKFYPATLTYLTYSKHTHKNLDGQAQVYNPWVTPP